MKKPASLAALGIALLQPWASRGQPAPSLPADVQTARGEYRGWPDAVFLRNGEVEAVIVPAIGRVMQFRFAGDADGPFWENRAPDGRPPAPEAGAWANYGGDKVWPAPQDAWTMVAGRAWPPPQGFDGQPARAEIQGDAVLLVFPPDAAYGLQMRRRIALAPGRAVMRITTTFEKTGGEPVKAGIWTITQVREPGAVKVPDSADAPVLLGGYAAPPMRAEPPWLVVTRDRAANHKIGLRADALLWIGPTSTLRIETDVVPGASYPDHGSSAEIYTNADPLPYVELELLGPLTTLKAGDRIEQTVTYTLSRPPAQPADRLPPH